MYLGLPDPDPPFYRNRPNFKCGSGLLKGVSDRIRNTAFSCMKYIISIHCWMNATIIY